MTKRKPLPKHWYFISIYYCPICNRTDEIRERRFGEKPKDRRQTHEFVEHYDYCDAL